MHPYLKAQGLTITTVKPQAKTHPPHRPLTMLHPSLSSRDSHLHHLGLHPQPPNARDRHNRDLELQIREQQPLEPGYDRALQHGQLELQLSVSRKQIRAVWHADYVLVAWVQHGVELCVLGRR